MLYVKLYNDVMITCKLHVEPVSVKPDCVCTACMITYSCFLHAGAMTMLQDLHFVSIAYIKACQGSNNVVIYIFNHMVTCVL